MFQIAKPLFYICETPLHAGAGGGIGTELPIQREAHTLFPKIEASGIKGALRETLEIKYKSKTHKDLLAIFGHPDNGDENAGALGFTDARILLFPVRSRQGVFAWVTCPQVLIRFERDLNVCVQNGGNEIAQNLLTLVKSVSKNKNTVTNSSIIVKGKDKHVYLEEYSIETDADSHTDAFAANLSELLKINELASQFVVIPNDYFSDFVQHCTEVHTRIKIGENGVVVDGALFTEEHLPAESILYSLTMAHPEFTDNKDRRTAEKIIELFENSLPEYVQIGGNATLGKGIVRIKKANHE